MSQTGIAPSVSEAQTNDPCDISAPITVYLVCERLFGINEPRSAWRRHLPLLPLALTSDFSSTQAVCLCLHMHQPNRTIHVPWSDAGIEFFNCFALFWHWAFVFFQHQPHCTDRLRHVWGGFRGSALESFQVHGALQLWESLPHPSFLICHLILGCFVIEGFLFGKEIPYYRKTA